MSKHLIDTDLYIDLIQSGTTLPLIHELYDATEKIDKVCLILRTKQ